MIHGQPSIVLTNADEDQQEQMIKHEEDSLLSQTQIEPSPIDTQTAVCLAFHMTHLYNFVFALI